jgi:hypothetical protein
MGLSAKYSLVCLIALTFAPGLKAMANRGATDHHHQAGFLTPVCLKYGQGFVVAKKADSRCWSPPDAVRF